MFGVHNSQVQHSPFDIFNLARLTRLDDIRRAKYSMPSFFHTDRPDTVIIRFSALCAYLKMRFLECALLRVCAYFKNCAKGCALISKAGQRSNKDEM